MKHNPLAFWLMSVIGCSSSIPLGDPDGDVCEPMPELCDGIDNDCDGTVDDGEHGGPLIRDCSTTCGPGTEECHGGSWGSCTAPLPADETCNGLDDDCNGLIDEDLALSFFLDRDRDGFGDPAVAITACEAPDGSVENSDDCDDDEPMVHPGAEELMDGIDNNCDGVVDEGCGCIPGRTEECGEGGDTGICEWGIRMCGDHEGSCEWGPCEGGVRPMPEACGDGLDNDCDGETDEEDCIPGVEPDPVRCWTVAPAGGQLALIEVDLDAGTWREIGLYGTGIAHSFHTAGMAYLDGRLVMPAHDGGGVHWYEIDLATGAVRRGSETMAEAVSVYRGGFVATCRESLGLCLYSDFDSLDAQTPSERFEEFICQTRFGVRGDEISCAWHSTDVVEVYDLRTGDHVRSIPLEDYDTWVWGVSVAGGRLHLIDDGRGEHEVPGQRIVSFDPLTGARLGEVHLTGLFPDRYTHWPGGLWCESPGPELP